MNKHKNVLILTQGIDGGVARMSSFLAQALHLDGFDVVNYYIGRRGKEDNYLNDLKNGIKADVYTTGEARSIVEVYRLLKSIFKVKKLITDFSPDIIVLNGQIPLICYFFLGWKKKKIFYDHGPQFSFQLIKKCLNKIALLFVNKIISVANFSAQNIVTETGYKGEINVITNCVATKSEVSMRSEIKNETSIRVIMAARIDFVQKDPITLIKAAEIAYRRGVDIRVDFAGDGPDARQLVDYIKQNECHEFITYLGHVTNLKMLAKNYNISCLSSHYESFGLSLVEGMASGHLAIGSNVCGIQDVIDNGVNGILFTKGDAEELAELFEKIYKHPELYKCHVSQALLDVQSKYTFECYSSRVLPIFRELRRCAN